MFQKHKKCFVSWSGGKDTCLACYKAMRDPDIEVTCLLNMVSEDGKYSRSHGVSSQVLREQASAIGLPIIQKKSSWDTYEKEFKEAVMELKKSGISAGIFGDIDFQVHRDWVERVCKDTGIKPIFPLWKGDRESIIKEFIASGFEAMVVSVRKDIIGPEWIGRKMDEKFLDHIRPLGNVDLCGEAGEYHTLVVSGPIFKRRMEVLEYV